jgi:pyridoxine 5-phosphate synthase
VAELAAAGIRVSLFIAPERAQIEAAAALGAPVVELHTGAWCDARAEGRSALAEAEFRRLREGAMMGRDLGLEVHAGHGLDNDTAEAIATLAEIVELNIGHFLIANAVFEGLGCAIKTMRAAMDRGRAQAASGP